MPLNIALDWDGTYTADPELWDAFIKLAQSRGHRVTFVTLRDAILEPINMNAPTVYCSRTAKAKHFNADIWIDDRPRWITEDHG